MFFHKVKEALTHSANLQTCTHRALGNCRLFYKDTFHTLQLLKHIYKQYAQDYC